jgi:adenosylcobinamide kinase/adenosylcobinamide-phosphate guanylyltransferase
MMDVDAVPGSLTLIIGGARSGKSARALELASRRQGVLFVATAEALDDDMATRIARHRAERPSHWRTLEAPRELPEIAAQITADSEAIVIDCLTLWVSNLMLGHATAAPLSERDILQRAADWLALRATFGREWIVVTNEVGLGLVPDTKIGREFRDTLGRVNALVAREATVVELLVAGVPVQIKG